MSQSRFYRFAKAMTLTPALLACFASYASAQTTTLSNGEVVNIANPLAGIPLKKNLPTRGSRFVSHPILMPASAVRYEGQRGGFSAAANADAILYSQRLFSSIESGFTPPAGSYRGDLLWTFPTIGYTESTRSAFSSIYRNALTTGTATTPYLALVQYGSIGKPGLLTGAYVRGFVGKIPPANTGVTPLATGSVDILVFDGVDFYTTGNEINFSKVAKTNAGANAQLRFPNTSASTGGRSFSFVNALGTGADTRIKITDPQGRFGIIFANADSTAANNDNQFWIFSPVATGPNQTFLLENGATTGTNAGARYVAAPGAYDATLNATDALNYGLPTGTYTVGSNNLSHVVAPYNFLYYVQGKNLDGTAASTGNIRGNVRRRGLFRPKDPQNPTAAAAPEGRPGMYEVDFYTPSASGTDVGTFAFARFFFNQPTYKADGSLTYNYELLGVPAGTWNLVFFNDPVSYGLFRGNTFNGLVTESRIAQEGVVLTNPAGSQTGQAYPGRDFLAGVLTGVVVNASTPPTDTSESGTVVIGSNGTFTNAPNLILERYGDIATSTGLGQDGTVDVSDLTAVLNLYNTADGDGKYNAAVDIAGPPDTNFSVQSGPDGAINVDDLSTVLFLYNTGSLDN